MMKNLLMAWRNLWRNKRRTLITTASVFFGVIIATLMSSMQEGSYNAMIRNIVTLYSGYIQVHHKEYWANKSINYSFVPEDSLTDVIDAIPEITRSAPRVETFALASSETLTKSSYVIGINPEAENKVTELKKWIRQGNYLEQGDSGVLLGAGLAGYLKLGIGDTLVIIGQGFHGISAAGKYPVRGIVGLPNPALDRQTIYMDLHSSQELSGLEDRITALVLMVESPYVLPQAVQKLKTALRQPYQAMTWEEMQPEVQRVINSDRQSAAVPKLILYIIIGFGIFGTVMMMILERRREMGVMIAIGMRRMKLATVLVYETIYMGIMGVVAGFLASMPIIAYFYYNPVRMPGNTGQAMTIKGFEPYLYFSWHPRVFYEQIIIVFLIILVIASYPVYSAKRLELTKALRD
jgi:ABC-type lipoprotein release transport system permease subunit